jgi:GTP pyrophosphokinase
MDDQGVLNDVTQVIAKDIGTQMRSINIESDKGKFEGILKILVFNVEHLEFVINRLLKVKGITSVTRGDK